METVSNVEIALKLKYGSSSVVTVQIKNNLTIFSPYNKMVLNSTIRLHPRCLNQLHL